jgi:4-amino-4-deoxy-L-arabinose transferase-like glycosyltransferase
VLALITFARSEDSVFSKHSTWIWRVWFGIILGCAAATKFTGWFIPIPFLAWCVLTRSRKSAVSLLFGLGLGAVIVFLLTPPWWSDPISGIARFLRSNLTRGMTQPISVLFLGHTYNTPNESLPWYNTIAWTVFVVPVGYLILALIGAFHTAIRRPRDPLALLFLINWVFVLALRSAPHVPGHDGIRLFLPAFGLLAGLAGFGAKVCSESRRRGSHTIQWVAAIEGILSIALMMPVPLSYYSPAVGLLPGATAIGMEPTYYWDALTPDAKAWLRKNTGPDERVQFATYPHSWLYLRRIGQLPDRILPSDFGRPRWYVVQNRAGSFHAWDPQIIRSVPASFTVRKLGVPLVWIFPYEQAVPYFARFPE